MKLPYFPLRFIHILTGLALAVVSLLLWYSNSLIQQLAQAEQDRLGLYADALTYISSHDNEEAEFLFNHLVKEGTSPSLVTVTAIQTDSKGNPTSDNLVLDAGLSTDQRSQQVRQELELMKADASHPPLRIEYFPGQYNYIYYRESSLVRQLRYFPYIVLAVLALFVTGAFFNLYISQRNNQNRVWAGLAKETAHQLGTPISGLMAWLELLQLQLQRTEAVEIVEEMGKDVTHLQNIAERFSKIGSEPELAYYPLGVLLERSLDYLRTRLGRSGKVNIWFENHLPNGYEVPINPVLFEWVIENLLKNALDALSGEPGSILLRAYRKLGSVVLEVEDTGKGIPKRHLKDVFRPGFTTKKRGWGLGLSLSKRIIEYYHRGKIIIRRSEVNKGTTFRITLPAYRRNLQQVLEPPAYEISPAAPTATNF